MATVKQLAVRKEKLLADLAKVNEEIAARAGEVDDEPGPKPNPSSTPPAKPKSQRTSD